MSDPRADLRASAREARKGPVAEAAEFKELVVAYAKQETVEPLRNLGHDLAVGIGGAFFIGGGILFGLLALLRGLQELTVFNDPAGDAGGRFSWVPYTIVAVVGALIAALFFARLAKALRRD